MFVCKPWTLIKWMNTSSFLKKPLSSITSWTTQDRFAGQAIPPFVIFDAKCLNHDWTDGEVPGTTYGLSSNGWIDSKVFHGWLIDHVKLGWYAPQAYATTSCPDSDKIPVFYPLQRGLDEVSGSCNYCIRVLKMWCLSLQPWCNYHTHTKYSWWKLLQGTYTCTYNTRNTA